VCSSDLCFHIQKKHIHHTLSGIHNSFFDVRYPPVKLFQRIRRDLCDGFPFHGHGGRKSIQFISITQFTRSPLKKLFQLWGHGSFFLKSSPDGRQNPLKSSVSYLLWERNVFKVLLRFFTFYTVISEEARWSF
jgi:hypothetical protein